MLIGFEYVVAAYGIWVGAFLVYILLTKRRLKIMKDSVAVLEERSASLSQDDTQLET